MLTEKPSKAFLMIKAQNAHLFNVAKNQPDLIAFLLQDYLLQNKERWIHWISRLIQQNKVSYIVDVIPYSDPKLPTKVYT